MPDVQKRITFGAIIGYAIHDITQFRHFQPNARQKTIDYDK